MEVQSTFQMKLEGIFTRQNSYQNPHSLQEKKFSMDIVRSMTNLYLHSKPLKLNFCCLSSRNQVNTERNCR